VSDKSGKYEKFDRGDAFIKEHTGSSTLINLDGRWEHNFVDDEEPPQVEEMKNKQS